MEAAAMGVALLLVTADIITEKNVFWWSVEEFRLILQGGGSKIAIRYWQSQLPLTRLMLAYSAQLCSVPNKAKNIIQGQTRAVRPE